MVKASIYFIVDKIVKANFDADYLNTEKYLLK